MPRCTSQGSVKVLVSKVRGNGGLMAKSCSTSLQPMGCPPGSSLHGISQARIVSGLLFPSPGDLPEPGTDSWSPAFEVDSLPSHQESSK